MTGKEKIPMRIAKGCLTPANRQAIALAIGAPWRTVYDWCSYRTRRYVTESA